MGLWDYALQTVAQTKAVLPVAGSAQDSLIEECVNEASQMVEEAWGRHIVSRGSLVEYHPRVGQDLDHELFLNEWPIVSVTDVHEDAGRTFDATTLLTVNTDYLVSKPTGKLIRLSGGLQTAWTSSWRAVKVTYLAGYQVASGTPVSGADAVPFAVLRVFNELVAWIYRQRSKQEVGLTVVNDSLGNRTFSGPAYVTPVMQQALRAAGASLPGYIRTGERDS